MDTFAFIASLIRSLAWPAAVLVALIILRRPLSQAIASISTLRYKELAIEFGRKVEDVAVEAAEVVVALPPERKALPPTGLERLARLAESSPRAAILEAWLTLEARALKTAQRLGLRVPPSGILPQSPNQALLALERSDVITDAAKSTIRDLRGLRNEAVHFPEFSLTEDAAATYVRVITSLIDYLDSCSAA